MRTLIPLLLFGALCAVEYRPTYGKKDSKPSVTEFKVLAKSKDGEYAVAYAGRVRLYRRRCCKQKKPTKVIYVNWETSRRILANSKRKEDSTTRRSCRIR